MAYPGSANADEIKTSFLDYETIKKEKVLACLKSLGVISPAALQALRSEWEKLIIQSSQKLTPAFLKRMQETPLLLYFQSIVSLKNSSDYFNIQIGARNSGLNMIKKAVERDAIQLMNWFSANNRVEKAFSSKYDKPILEQLGKIKGPFLNYNKEGNLISVEMLNVEQTVLKAPRKSFAFLVKIPEKAAPAVKSSPSFPQAD